MTFEKPVDRSAAGIFKVRIWANAEGYVAFSCMDSRVFEQTGLMFAFGMPIQEFNQMVVQVGSGGSFELVGLARTEEKNGE